MAWLKQYGYDVTGADTEKAFKQLVKAFQLHFRAANYDGVLDAGTAAALAAKYFRGSLEAN